MRRRSDLKAEDHRAIIRRFHGNDSFQNLSASEFIRDLILILEADGLVAFRCVQLSFISHPTFGSKTSQAPEMVFH